MPAAGYLATVLIAQQHRATDGRRNRLRSALRAWPGRWLALVREWTAHMGFVAAIAAFRSSSLLRALATRRGLTLDHHDLLRIAARHFHSFCRNFQ